jgi:hypothetical protein
LNASNSFLIRSWLPVLCLGAAFSVLLFAGCDSANSDGEDLAPTAGWHSIDFPWSSLEFPHFGHVVALTVHDGDLIVGGAFGAGNRIARWDGSTWRQMGTGMNHPVLAFTIFDGDLIAGGVFTTAGGQSANRIARWDGSAWHAVGTGIWDMMDADAHVTSVTVHDGDLIAAGSFTTAGGQEANNVARWDGSEWQPMGAGIEHRVLALAVHDGALIAGGEGGFSRWDGSVWTSTAAAQVHAFTTYNGDLIAGGYINAGAVARWTGSTWQPVGAGTREYANAFAVYDGDLIAGGDFPFTFGAGTNHIARWDGSTWRPMGEGMDADISALTVYNGDLIAAGGFLSAGGNARARFIARWGLP